VHCFLLDGNGFPTHVDGPAWSDAAGWGAEKHYATIQLADINGDGKADVCGRAGDRVHCQLSDGNGFPTHVDGPAWSDASGWGEQKHYATVQLADLNGDGKAGVCGRAGDGMHCFLSDGNGFPTHIDGPPWSEASGWDDVFYWATIQLADVNGDGKADVCARERSCALLPLRRRLVPVGDPGPSVVERHRLGEPEVLHHRALPGRGAGQPAATLARLERRAPRCGRARRRRRRRAARRIRARRWLRVRGRELGVRRRARADAARPARVQAKKNAPSAETPGAFEA
jgi:hypothetical protein